MRIEPLSLGDAEAVANLLDESADAEGRFFDGLPREEEAVRDALAKVRDDGYWGFRVNDRLTGIFMLRGFDAGYRVPAFGVVISPEFRGLGLGRLALQYCETWCRLRGIPELMLTVAAENCRAVGLYKSAGFALTDERSTKGHPIYRKRLGP